MTARSIPRFDPAPSGRLVQRAVAELGIDAALIGRLAMWFHLPDPSQHELTKDVDVAIRAGARPLIESWLKRNGMRTHPLSIGGVGVKHAATSVAVDFIDRSKRGSLSPLFGEAIDAALRSKKKDRVLFDIEGEEVALPVVPAEHLVAMKLGTGEAKDERDARRMLGHARLDMKKLRDLVARHLGVGAQNRLEAILRELNHRSAVKEPKGRYRTS